jgi:hypothetical protein
MPYPIIRRMLDIDTSGAEKKGLRRKEKTTDSSGKVNSTVHKIIGEWCRSGWPNFCASYSEQNCKSDLHNTHIITYITVPQLHHLLHFEVPQLFNSHAVVKTDVLVVIFASFIQKYDYVVYDLLIHREVYLCYIIPRYRCTYMLYLWVGKLVWMSRH